MNNLLQILNPNHPLLYILIAWEAVWKGISLWHSARNKQLPWFIAILIINSVGILPIVYLIFFRKKGIKETLPLAKFYLIFS